MPKRSPAKIDYRDCEKRGRRCLLISQQCRWRFGKISLSVFRYDTSSDSAIGKQLKLPVHSILNQSQLNHIWDQYGRCLYACTIDDKLVVKRVSVVFCRSAFALPSQHRDSQQLSLLRTRTQLWWEVLSLVENWRQKHILKIARCSLWSALIRTGCALTTMHGGILSCYSDFLLSSLNLPCHSPNNRMTMATCYTVIGELITGSGNGNRPTFYFIPFHFQNDKWKIASILFTFISLFYYLHDQCWPVLMWNYVCIYY